MPEKLYSEHAFKVNKDLNENDRDLEIGLRLDALSFMSRYATREEEILIDEQPRYFWLLESLTDQLQALYEYRPDEPNNLNAITEAHT